MKKLITVLLTLVFAFVLFGCEDKPKKKDEVMSFTDFEVAELDSEVFVETYVQAKQQWFEEEGKGFGTIYTQSIEGGYFLYKMPCTKEEYDSLVPGTKIRVKGIKSEWAGEVEITEAKFEILDGNKFIAPAKDITSMLDNDGVIRFQNQAVEVKNVIVESTFLYKYNGSGSEGDDLYFNVSYKGKVYTFCVESSLCAKDSDVYKAVKDLKIGDTVNLKGFLYWYNGLQPHITDVYVVNKAAGDASTAMTYKEFQEAAIDSQVTVVTYVQAKQSYYAANSTGTFYTQSPDGAYFIYNMVCTKEEYDKLEPGTKILVTGTKAEWAGEVEIIDAQFVILDGAQFEPTAKDITALLESTDLIEDQNKLICVKDAVVAKEFLYKYNGTGSEGDDLYFDITVDGKTYTFCVESYLCDADSQTYKAVKELKVGDKIDIEGFLYWYNGLQPHVTKVTVTQKAPQPAE